MSSLGIVELVDVCQEMERRSSRLFELTGSWINDEDDPATQRLLAEACHRHAWHVELWQTRTPTIPIDEVDRRDPAASSVRHVEPPTTADDRIGWYHGELAAIRTELDLVRTRLDPDLDPSTIRTIGLVDADLADLESRLPATGDRIAPASE